MLTEFSKTSGERDINARLHTVKVFPAIMNTIVCLIFFEVNEILNMDILSVSSYIHKPLGEGK